MEVTKNDEKWIIAENEFSANPKSDFSQNNGTILQNSNFEESCSSETNRGTYLKGIFSFKNNNKQLALLPDWTSLNVRLNTEQLDISVSKILNFNRTINMYQGILERNFEVVTPTNQHIEVSVQRFLSIKQPEIAAIRYSVKSINFAGRISFLPVINGDINTGSSDEDLPEWNVLQSKTLREVAHLWIQTRKTDFQVCEAMTYDLFKNNAQIKYNPTKIEKQKVAGFSLGIDVKEGDTVCVYKFVSILNSTVHPYNELTTLACDKALQAKQLGWNELTEENIQEWSAKWNLVTNNDEKTLSKEEIIKYYQQLSSFK